MTSGFPEVQLVQNRASVLLFGGADADRRAWAEEAALRLREDGVLTALSNEAELPQLLLDGRRVLFIPDIAAVSNVTQMLLVKTLLEREDRPKLILGLGVQPMDARQKGKLRDDLAYRLQMAQVDLSQPGIKGLLKDRRAKLERELERRRAEAERAERERVRQQKAALREQDKAAAPKPAAVAKAVAVAVAKAVSKPVAKAIARALPKRAASAAKVRSTSKVRPTAKARPAAKKKQQAKPAKARSVKKGKPAAKKARR